MKSDTTAHGVVLLATFIVATTFPIGQRIAPFLDPVIVVLLRFLISIVVMLPMLLFTKIIEIPTFYRFRQFAIIGVIHAGFFICMFLALKHTNSLNTSAIYTLVPSIAAIVCFFVLGEPIKHIHYLLLPLGVVSTLWVIFEGDMNRLGAMEFNKGDLIFFAGCLLLGVYTTLLKKYHVAGSTLNLVFWAMISGVVPMSIYAASADIDVNFGAVPLDVYAWIIYLAVLTVLTSYIWAYGAPRLGPMKTLAYSYLIPSFVMVIDGVLLGRWPPAIVLPGVLVGVVVMIVLQSNQVTAASARTPELGR